MYRTISIKLSNIFLDVRPNQTNRKSKLSFFSFTLTEAIVKVVLLTCVYKEENAKKLDCALAVTFVSIVFNGVMS